MQTFERFLHRAGRWPVVLALALASLFWMSLLAQVGNPPEQPSATALDLRWGYTPAEVEQAMAPLSPARRAQAARAHLTLDVAYPLTYGLLFALLLARLWSQHRWWLLAPAMVLADLTENVLLAALYRGYPQRLTWVPWASLATRLKWSLVGLVFLLLLAGTLRQAFRRFAER